MEEMLGFTPNFEHLDDELEIVASPQHIRMEGESRAESPVLEKKRTLANHCSSFHMILSIIVVLAAIGGSFFLTMWRFFSEEVLEGEDEVFEEEVIIEETSAFDDEF